MTVKYDASVPTVWRKSSYSNGEGAECVEVADGLPGILPVRDSKNPHGPTLTFQHTTWHTFVTALQEHRLPPTNV